MILGKRGEVCLISLSRAILGYADLSDSSLFGADLTSTDLRYADLTNADLLSAILAHSILGYADLTNADLSNTDTTDSDLHYVDLTNTTLYLTDLREYLFECNGLYTSNFTINTNQVHIVDSNLRNI